MAMLLPEVVVTVTFTAPTLAVVGTLHMICAACQKPYLVHVLLPTCTALMPRGSPNHLPVIVTSAPRLPEAD